MTGIFFNSGSRLDLPEHFHAIDFGHADIEQEQVGGFPGPPARAAAEEKIQNVLAVFKPLDRIVQVRRG